MDDKDSSLLTEYSKLINELVNARRELARLNATLSDRERFLSRILAISPSVVYLYDLQSRVYVFTSRPPVSLLGFDGEKELKPESDPGILEAHREALAVAGDGEVLAVEFSAAHADGSLRWLRAKETVFFRDPEGRPRQVLGVLDDITLQKESEEALRKDSTLDALTGLHNRRGFIASANILLQSSNLRSISCALLFFDLDQFKKINDVYGHAQGDLALKLFAESLRTTFRTADVISRFGGDEFVVLTSGITPHNLGRILKRLESSQKSLHKAAERAWVLSWSFGVSYYAPGEKLDLESLIESADAQMYKNKAGKSEPRPGSISG
jgi:diguanylate cyclase (GGDEF)-like protein/PAS domain S-box-containing protein